MTQKHKKLLLAFVVTLALGVGSYGCAPVVLSGLGFGVTMTFDQAPDGGLSAVLPDAGLTFEP